MVRVRAICEQGQTHTLQLAYPNTSSSPYMGTVGSDGAAFPSSAFIHSSGVAYMELQKRRERKVT